MGVCGLMQGPSLERAAFNQASQANHASPRTPVLVPALLLYIRLWGDPLHWSCELKFSHSPPDFRSLSGPCAVDSSATFRSSGGTDMREYHGFSWW